jgi:double-stranded uracil-DNA glycosylase
MMAEILPDVLAPDLRVVFCGTAAGNESARQGAYYAHPGNKFWRTLYQTGLTPHQILPREYATVLRYGIGLTDLAKFVSGNDDQLRPEDFDAAALQQKIAQFKPQAFAFTSKTAGSIFYRSKAIRLGRQPEPFGTTTMFVLPSPSGLAIRSWDIRLWQEVADFVESLA